MQENEAKGTVQGSALVGYSQRNNFLTVEQAFLECGNIPLLEIFEQKEMTAYQGCCNGDSCARWQVDPEEDQQILGKHAGIVLPSAPTGITNEGWHALSRALDSFQRSIHTSACSTAVCPPWTRIPFFPPLP